MKTCLPRLEYKVRVYVQPLNIFFIYSVAVLIFMASTLLNYIGFAAENGSIKIIKFDLI